MCPEQLVSMNMIHLEHEVLSGKEKHFLQNDRYRNKVKNWIVFTHFQIYPNENTEAMSMNNIISNSIIITKMIRTVENEQGTSTGNKSTDIS